MLVSTSSFGSPDLDLRSAVLARYTIGMWVQRCPSCGYCAPSISTRVPGAREVVDSAEYRELLGQADLPQLARSFLCASLVLEKGGETVAAARKALEAAWACDDEGAVGSVQCRRLTVRLLRECEARGDVLFPDPHTGHAVIADILRRAELFNDAVAEVDKVVGDATGPVAVILAFSRLLALARDSGGYTVDAAMSWRADEEIVEALRALVGFGESGEHFAKSLILTADHARNYYVRFAIDERGLLCEVVNNRHLAAQHAFTGDEIAQLLALDFYVPDREDQNVFRVLHPESDEDYGQVVGLVRAVVTDYFGLPPAHPLHLETTWEHAAGEADPPTKNVEFSDAGESGYCAPITDLAIIALAHLEQSTRSDGSSSARLKDGAPAWVRKMLDQVHEFDASGPPGDEYRGGEVVRRALEYIVMFAPDDLTDWLGDDFVGGEIAPYTPRYWEDDDGWWHDDGTGSYSAEEHAGMEAIVAWNAVSQMLRWRAGLSAEPPSDGSFAATDADADDDDLPF